MAIYHFSVKVISRGKGQSAVASASYRSDEKLYFEREGKTFSFRPHKVQPDTFILAPNHAPEWVHNRERLWNEVENIERRKDSQLAREVEVALPKELSYEQQKELIKSYVQREFVDCGMIADVAIHRDDENNPHAHVMLTTREIDRNGNWARTKNRDWNDKELLESWRKNWAFQANKALEREGIKQRIDHRSHAERGLETLPTKHLGHKAHAMEKKGIKTERGDYNRDVEEYNKSVVDLAKYREEKKVLQERVKTKKFLKPHELVLIKNATKVINERGKGFVSLSSIGKRRTFLANKERALDRKESNLFNQQTKFDRAKSMVDRLENIERQKQNLMKEIHEVKDIRGVWQNNKWEGTKKAFERTFNRRIGNQQIERAEEGIKYLEDNKALINKDLEPYRKQLKFTTNKQFYAENSKFEKTFTKEMATIKNQRNEIKVQRATLDKAEQALQRKEVREITSNYPELSHLSETMRYKDALNIKKVNDRMGETVPIDNMKKELHLRTENIHKLENQIQEINKKEKLFNQLENHFNKLDRVQTEINKVENSVYHRNKIKTPFFKEERREHEQNIMERDRLQKTLDKSGITKEDYLKGKAQFEVIKQGKPNLEQQLNQEREGKSGVSVEHLEKILKGVERAQKEYEKEYLPKEKGYEYEREN